MEGIVNMRELVDQEGLTSSNLYYSCCLRSNAYHHVLTPQSGPLIIPHHSTLIPSQLASRSTLETLSSSQQATHGPGP